MLLAHPTCIRVFRMFRSLTSNVSSRDRVVPTSSEVPSVAFAAPLQ